MEASVTRAPARTPACCAAFSNERAIQACFHGDDIFFVLVVLVVLLVVCSSSIILSDQDDVRGGEQRQ